MERICRLPSEMVLERTQNPSTTRQHSVACSPSRTTACSAAYFLTLIGRSRMILISSSEMPTEVRRRLTSAAEMDSLDRRDSDFAGWNRNDFLVSGHENRWNGCPFPTGVG